MISMIEQKAEEIARLCEQFHAVRLDVFVSAVRSDFKPNGGDLDFIVTFADLPPVEYARAHLGLLMKLEELFQHDVDLITESSIRNPYFLRNVNATRQKLYERSRVQAAV